VRGRALVLVAVVASAACYRDTAPRALTEADCVPVAGDHTCLQCLKTRCCAESVAHMNGERGGRAKVFACADERCAAECPAVTMTP
jgi:hypothetical protein